VPFVVYFYIYAGEFAVFIDGAAQVFGQARATLVNAAAPATLNKSLRVRFGGIIFRL